MHLTHLGDSHVPSNIDAAGPSALGGEATLGAAHSHEATFALIALDDRHRIARAAAWAWEAKRMLHALPLANLLEFV
jgi:hypothetical protein